jgi:predicted metalloprotease
MNPMKSIRQALVILAPMAAMFLMTGCDPKEPTASEFQEGKKPALEPAPAIDLNRIEAKMESGKRFLDSYWLMATLDPNVKYNSPKVVRYSGTIKSACGEIQEGNAFFCPAENAIYYDHNFLSKIQTAAEKILHTDGDFAAIIVLAHEWGHQVRWQLRRTAQASLEEEGGADCLAGASAKTAEFARLLDPDDIQEAKLSLALGGDAELDPTDPDAHGTPRQRISRFLDGYKGGLAACGFPEFSKIETDRINAMVIGHYTKQDIKPDPIIKSFVERSLQENK